jgi:hypothetical protein
VNRLIPLAVLLALGTGCLSADFMFPAAVTTEAYDFSESTVPETNMELVSFKREDDVLLYGLWLRQDPSDARPPLIYFHGNGHHLGEQPDRMDFFWGWGTHDVFMFDYAGYGQSEGEATYDGLKHLDGPAAIRYVSQLTGYPPTEIPWVCTSLGGFVCLHTNGDFQAQAIVTEDVFANSDLLLDDSFGIDIAEGWFFEHDWDNVSAIAQTLSPISIIHGLDDAFISADSGPLLFDAAPGPNKELWQPAGVDHADLPNVMPDAYKDRALDWFGQFGPGVPDPIVRDTETADE